MKSSDALAIHSRSVLAGYDPRRIFAGHVIVIGAGALGQNLLQTLALAGVGKIDVIDPDVFQPHNATRSPLFPLPSEAAIWGQGKAPVVAQKVRSVSTAPNARVRYAAEPIQALGDTPLADADIVISAVDTVDGRAYLAERCRLVGRPLLEGGFNGAEVQFALYGWEAGEACFRCGNPNREGASSCTRYALQAEAEGVIPAIQTGASMLGALMAEQALLWLQGEETWRGSRIYGDVRKATCRRRELSRDPKCPGVHREVPEATTSAISCNDTVGDLLRSVRNDYGRASVRLPDPFVERIACTNCGSLVDADCPEWRWLLQPRCLECGGVRGRSSSQTRPPSMFGDDLHTDDQELRVAELTCATVGLQPGSLVQICGDDGLISLMRIGGSAEHLLTEAVPN